MFAIPETHEFSTKEQMQLRPLLEIYQNDMPTGAENAEARLAILSERLFGCFESSQSVVWYPLKSIITAMGNQSVIQRPLILSKVFSVLADKSNGLLFHHPNDFTSFNPLLIPPIMGTALNEEPSIEAGRHRITAILWLLRKCGIPLDIPAAADDFKIPCFELPKNNARIVADNVSRGATQLERVGINESSTGVNINSPDELIAAFEAGKLSGSTARSNASKLVRLMAPLVITSDRLTSDTKGAIAVSLVSLFNTKYPNQKYATIDPTFLSTMLDCADSFMDEVLDSASGMGYSNFSRSSKVLAGLVLFRLVEGIKGGRYVVPTASESQTRKRSVKAVAAETNGHETNGHANIDGTDVTMSAEPATKPSRRSSSTRAKKAKAASSKR